MSNWNPWHGCKKISPGCKNCYVYRQDFVFDKDSSIVSKNKGFYLPILKKRNGEYKLKNNETVYTCLTSDFFLDEADQWRKEAWEMIKERQDVDFFIITKRIDRFNISLPKDWGDGYENVSIACTVENQKMADYRLPIFLDLPIKHKSIACAPILERIDFTPYLNKSIEILVLGGESGKNARICNYSWVLDIRNQCVERDIPFYFQQTGTKFVKDKKLFIIERKLQHSQAKKAEINFKI